jgi:hypothetical protein
MSIKLLVCIIIKGSLTNDYNCEQLLIKKKQLSTSAYCEPQFKLSLEG